MGTRKFLVFDVKVGSSVSKLGGLFGFNHLYFKLVHGRCFSNYNKNIYNCL